MAKSTQTKLLTNAFIEKCYFRAYERTLVLTIHFIINSYPNTLNQTVCPLLDAEGALFPAPVTARR
jgi:hypothetical protein